MRQLSDSANPLTRDDALSEEAPLETSKRRYWHHRPTTTAITQAVPFGNLPAAGRVFVVGMPRGDELDRWVAGRADVDLFLDAHHPMARTPGRMVTDAALWFGADAVPEYAAEAWRWVETQLRAGWKDSEVCLSATPGTTGRDLWLRTAAADGCPLMGTEAQQLVRSTSGQGRIETYPPRAEMLPALYEYDMRVAYAAVLRGLPMGEPEDWGDSPLGLECIRAGLKSRVELSFTVPEWWNHVGLLSVREEDGSLSWPATPGHYGPTWADGAEVALAEAEGWTVRVHRTLVWERSGDPLRTWTDRLTAILKAATSLSPALYGPARSMVRAIILHTIGAFHGAPQRTTVRAATLAEAPIGADNLRLHDDGSVTWREYRPAAWPEACHPEWSAHVWARNRVRLLRHPAGGGMLTVDPRTLVACRTDAIYTTTPTGWEAGDSGQIGRWVLKHVDTEPAPWPLTGLDVVDLRDGGY